MKYINLDSITQAITPPNFDGYLLNNFIQEDKHAILNNAFPQTGFEKALTGDIQRNDFLWQASYRHEFICIDDLTKLNGITQSQVWDDFFKELSSDKYLQHLGKLVQMDLTDKEIIFEFMRYQPGDFVSKHYDKQPKKVLVQLFYFNYVWDIRWGGNFKLLSNDHSEILSLPPLIHSSILLKASPKAWHEVTPMTADANMRIGLQVEWFQKD